MKVSLLLSVHSNVTLEVRCGWCWCRWCETNLLRCGHIIVQSIPAGVYLHDNLTVSRKLLLVHKDGHIIIIDVVLNEEGGEMGNTIILQCYVCEKQKTICVWCMLLLHDHKLWL